mmetsp:Transcript_4331/g.9877  ORF Transcript_4331/g.9877 Transcript_4331/m.9877 type:complete len:267 (+) Transcript_4331:141-941(+)
MLVQLLRIVTLPALGSNNTVQRAAVTLEARHQRLFKVRLQPHCPARNHAQPKRVLGEWGALPPCGCHKARQHSEGVPVLDNRRHLPNLLQKLLPSTRLGLKPQLHEDAGTGLPPTLRIPPEPRVVEEKGVQDLSVDRSHALRTHPQKAQPRHDFGVVLGGIDACDRQLGHDLLLRILRKHLAQCLGLVRCQVGQSVLGTRENLAHVHTEGIPPDRTHVGVGAAPFSLLLDHVVGDGLERLLDDEKGIVVLALVRQIQQIGGTVLGG